MSVNPVPASIKKAGLPDGFNDLAVFDLDNPDMALFDTFSDKLKTKIQSCPEWKGSANEQYQKQQNASAFSDDDESDIPF
jgi:hypothetical protein